MDRVVAHAFKVHRHLLQKAKQTAVLLRKRPGAELEQIGVDLVFEDVERLFGLLNPIRRVAVKSFELIDCQRKGDFALARHPLRGVLCLHKRQRGVDEQTGIERRRRYFLRLGAVLDQLADQLFQHAGQRQHHGGGDHHKAGVQNGDPDGVDALFRRSRHKQPENIP